MISLRSDGLALYKKEAIIELMQTLLPEPVAPAIRRCGIPLRSATILFPEMSFPTTKVSLDSEFANSGESISSRTRTVAGLSFSTSIPTAALPGIGASILIDFALRFKAISSTRLVILDTLTPVAGCTSYLVTEAPCVTLRILASTPKSARVCCKSADFCSS